MTSSDRFPVPVSSAVKSNFTDWCCQNLSKRALNALTVQASTTELGKLFQTFTMRAEKMLSRGMQGMGRSLRCTIALFEMVEPVTDNCGVFR